MTDPFWREKALCAQIGGDEFFPEKTGDHASWRRAVSVCRSCPVQVECLQYALDNNEAFGVWGGTTPRQRGRIRRGVSETPRPATVQERRNPNGHGKACLCSQCRGFQADRRRECAQCGVLFTAVSPKALYCEQACKHKAYRAKNAGSVRGDVA